MASYNRGFKTWAERSSVNFRKTLGLQVTDPLSPALLASHLNVRLLTPKDVPGLPSECVEQLLVADPEGWSGVTVKNGTGHTVIYNPRHSPKRQAADIMHELSHIICGHAPSHLIISAEGEMVMRTHDQQQEDEADWLSGCLLLPRDTLLQAKLRGLSNDQIQERYLVSAARLQYRLSMTGVETQMRRRRRQSPPTNRRTFLSN